MAVRRLPKEGEPLKLPNGQVVLPKQPDRSGILRFIEVPNNNEAQRLVGRTKRKLADLPAVPQHLNVASVVLMYKLFGLEDEEVALASNLTVDQVKRVQTTSTYREVEKTVIETVLKADLADVRYTLMQAAHKAASNMTDFLDSEEDGVRFAASKEILDRSGHKAADIVEHRHKLDGALLIEVVDKSGDKDMPVMDLSAERIE